MFSQLSALETETVWLSSLDLAKMQQGWGKPLIDKAGRDKPIAIAKQTFEHGVATGQGPRALDPPGSEAVILTPKPPPAPQINGPKVYRCRPGHPLLYRIPATGIRPMKFSASGLPKNLRLDPQTGVIAGSIPVRGEFKVTLKASNAHGKAIRSFKIVCGDGLALTPPMGWNHWYAHYDRVTDAIMRQAADEMIRSGMADVDYQYVNIDDCWMNAENHKDPLRIGPPRDPQGNLIPNRHFPDMKALTDYIHAKGLKAGIYSSPAPSPVGVLPAVTSMRRKTQSSLRIGVLISSSTTGAPTTRWSRTTPAWRRYRGPTV